MKPDWEKLLSKEVSNEARDRIFASADRLIDELHGEKKPSWLERLFSPMGGLALAGSVAAVLIVLSLQKGPAPRPENIAGLDPEMIGNLELLLELETLEHWDPKTGVEVKTKWPKKPT